MSDFKAALPQVIKWSTGENKYDQTGKSPITMSLFVPVESAFAFAQYVLNMADDETRHKAGSNRSGVGTPQRELCPC
jgi:DNA anti-recombination protein RmuC